MAACIRLLGLAFLLALAGVAGAVAADERPQDWGRPMPVSSLPNLHQVAPGLYRSAQPETVGGLAAIRGLGIRTVISLRASDADAKLGHSPGIDFLRHPLWTWDVDDEDVLAVLRVMTDPRRQPVLVHCKHGADRTGLMVASYRVVVQGWSKQAALEEMKRGGYGFHPVWRNIERRLLALDVSSLRAALATAGAASPGA